MEEAGEGPGMAVKLQHGLHAESSSNPPMDGCAGTSAGCQLSALGTATFFLGPCWLLRQQPLWPHRAGIHLFPSAMAEQQ